MTSYIYEQSGRAVGFINSRFIHDMRGRGWSRSTTAVISPAADIDRLDDHLTALDVPAVCGELARRAVGSMRGFVQPWRTWVAATDRLDG